LVATRAQQAPKNHTYKGVAQSAKRVPRWVRVGGDTRTNSENAKRELFIHATIYG
jgi:hypothetical protein